jgi:preprotein translocase subunit SecA
MVVDPDEDAWRCAIRTNTTGWTRRLRHWLGDTVEVGVDEFAETLRRINSMEASWRELDDSGLEDAVAELRRRAQTERDPDAWMLEVFAAIRELAHRSIGLRPFDEQLTAGLALASGAVVEMPTGEGKTLAAVAPVAWAALTGGRVHVLTFNDYLARRDAIWMGPIYTALGLSVGVVQEDSSFEDRQRAYDCDITYLTAKEAGFDYLRTYLCLDPEKLLRREAAVALVDEADSIFIDEARIPLVIAGAVEGEKTSVRQAAAVARQLRDGIDFDTDEYGHNIFLTETGSVRVEASLCCGNLYDSENLGLLADLRNAIHALHLVERDRDYIVREGRVELVDDFTGRVAENRQWPDGLQAAIEAKESLDLKDEGRILGSITMHHFLRTYPRLCGMTATATPSAEELRDWTNQDGRTITAALLSLDETAATLKLDNGREYEIHLATLS